MSPRRAASRTTVLRRENVWFLYHGRDDGASNAALVDRRVDCEKMRRGLRQMTKRGPREAQDDVQLHYAAFHKTHANVLGTKCL